MIPFAPSRPRNARLATPRPRVETLEGRQLLSTLPVNGGVPSKPVSVVVVADIGNDVANAADSPAGADRTAPYQRHSEAGVVPAADTLARKH